VKVGLLAFLNKESRKVVVLKNRVFPIVGWGEIAEIGRGLKKVFGNEENRKLGVCFLFIIVESKRIVYNNLVMLY